MDALLSLQQPRSDRPEHDEMLFIVIHQVYELWFKELLHELDRVVTLLRKDEPHRAQHTREPTLWDGFLHDLSRSRVSMKLVSD